MHSTTTINSKSNRLYCIDEDDYLNIGDESRVLEDGETFDQDSESSIISGLTNLYLNKTSKKKENFYLSTTRSKLTPPSNQTNDAYSFYQTETKLRTTNRDVSNNSHLKNDSNFGRNLRDNIHLKQESIKNHSSSNNTKRFIEILFERGYVFISRLVFGLNAFMLTAFIFKWYISADFLNLHL